MGNISRKHLRQKREDSIPYDKPYRELTEDQILELHEMFENSCKVLGWKLHQKTLGVLSASDCIDELQTHLYVMMKALQEEEPKKDKEYNVVGYLRKGLNNQYRIILDKYFDEKMVREQFSRKIANDLLVNTEEDKVLEQSQAEEAAKESESLVRDITEAAEALGVEVNTEDWVVTALNVIRLGVHGKLLEGELFDKMDYLRERLEATGHKTRSSTEITEPLGWGVEEFVKKLVEEDPEITTAEVKKKLQDRGTPIPPTLSGMVCRSRAGNVPEKSNLSDKVRKLYVEENITDINTIQERLVAMGVIFKPSQVRAYVRNLKKTGKCSR